MVPAQNVVPRSQLDILQKKNPGGSNLEPEQREINSWRSNSGPLGPTSEPFQEKSVPGGPVRTFLGFQNSHSWKKLVPGGPN